VEFVLAHGPKGPGASEVVIKDASGAIPRARSPPRVGDRSRVGDRGDRGDRPRRERTDHSQSPVNDPQSQS